MMTPTMSTADLAELESIRRFREFDAFWKMISTTARRADALARLEIVLLYETTQEVHTLVGRSERRLAGPIPKESPRPRT